MPRYFFNFALSMFFSSYVFDVYPLRIWMTPIVYMYYCPTDRDALFCNYDTITFFMIDLRNFFFATHVISLFL